MVPYKTIQAYSTWTIVVPLPDVWMYLASPRASPSWTSSTGQGRQQAAGQRSVVHEQDDGIGLRIQNAFSLLFWVFCALFYLLSFSGAHTDLPVDPDDRALRRHTHSIPPQYVLSYSTTPSPLPIETPPTMIRSPSTIISTTVYTH